MAFLTQHSTNGGVINMSSFVVCSFFVICCFSVVYGRMVTRSVLRAQSDFPLDTAEIIDLHGYNGEVHNIKTKDDYYLTVHRITGRKDENNNNINGTKPVVLLMHGLLCSSSSWVLAGPETGLGYILADQGYDVWMGNFRGNKYSKKHEKFNTASMKFWDFTWHEMGQYDLPAMINHTIAVTNSEKIFYVGHSQGTTAYFVMSSLYPEYAEKTLHTAVAMAPVVYMSHVRSRGFKMLIKAVNSIFHKTVQTLLALRDIGDATELFKMVMNYFCDKSQKVQPMCENLLFTLGGYDEAQSNKTLLPIIWNHVPAGASMKQILHYGQLINSGKFRMYDKGMLSNMYNYRTFSPPEYDLTNSQVKVALYYSDNDWISTHKDVDRLHAELPDATKYRINYDNFTHIDFIWANDVKELLYDKVLDYMNNFIKNK